VRADLVDFQAKEGVADDVDGDVVVLGQLAKGQLRLPRHGAARRRSRSRSRSRNTTAVGSRPALHGSHI